MLLRDASIIALCSIRTNVLRSLLTMLGIIIGVASVILMTSIGASIEALILGQVSTLGAQSMIVVPGQDRQGGMPMNIESLTADDIEAMRHLSTVTTVAPVITVNGIATYGNEEVSHQILGTTADFFENQQMTVDNGRLLTSLDDDRVEAVAVLGPDTAESLFGDSDPLGKNIRILDRSFRVIGVLRPVGSQFFQTVDERIYIPFSVANVLTGQNFVNFATLQSTTNIDLAAADITSLLRQRHRIRNQENDPEKDDFHVHSAEQATQILGVVSLALTALLTAIAAISLVVGGIGIMNIMLVAVTERTREIGLRKAVGAKRRDILLQFLIEAVLLTFLGGIIGILTGIGAAFVGSIIARQFFSGYVFAVNSFAVAIAAGVAAAVGLVFGLYPARRAASLNPIEALRYE